MQVDSNYRTNLGVRFYNRARELRELDWVIDRYMTILVYGPRNVGKSELVRYWAWRRGIRGRMVSVEGDTIRAGNILDSLSWDILSADEKARKIVEESLRSLAERLGLHDIYNIISRIKAPLRASSGRTIVFVDEFHLLPRYRNAPLASRYETALADLEALAHYLSKRPDLDVRFVLTVSEGFIATGEARQRLHGYSSLFLLVDHLDNKHFRGLFTEYTSKNPCPHSYTVVRRIIGGAPGYLPEVCSGHDGLERFIENSKGVVEEGLSGVMNALRDSQGWDVSPVELLETALALMKGKRVRPLEDSRMHLIGQVMTTHNLVYPVYEQDSYAITYKPQIPLYRLILEAAVEHGLASVLPVSVDWVLSRI